MALFDERQPLLDGFGVKTAVVVDNTDAIQQRAALNRSLSPVIFSELGGATQT